MEHPVPPQSASARDTVDLNTKEGAETAIRQFREAVTVMDRIFGFVMLSHAQTSKELAELKALHQSLAAQTAMTSGASGLGGNVANTSAPLIAPPTMGASVSNALDALFQQPEVKNAPVQRHPSETRNARVVARMQEKINSYLHGDGDDQPVSIEEYSIYVMGPQTGLPKTFLSPVIAPGARGNIKPGITYLRAPGVTHAIKKYGTFDPDTDPRKFINYSNFSNPYGGFFNHAHTYGDMLVIVGEKHLYVLTEITTEQPELTVYDTRGVAALYTSHVIELTNILRQISGLTATK